MAINKLYSPADPPTANTDWTRMKALVDALALQNEQPLRVVGSNVVKGAMFYIGGTFYLADSDTAISGTSSNYVKITPSGDGSTCSASFVSSLTGVTWNATYLGYYDSGSPASFYIFDEGKALTAGQISAIRNTKNEVVPLGAGWLAVLAIAIGSGWLAALGTALGSGWTTALAAAATAFNADTLDTYHASKTLVEEGVIPVRAGGVVGGIKGPIKISGSASVSNGTGTMLWFLLHLTLVTNGDAMIVSGSLSVYGSSETLIISRAALIGGTSIRFYGFNLVARTIGYIDVSSGDSTRYTAEFAW